MFNSEIKERYITGKPEKTANNIKNLFVASESFENKFGKDVAEFNIQEIASYFDACGFCEPDTIRNRICKYAAYADWYCSQVGLTGHSLRDYTVSSFPYSKHLAPLLTLSPEDLLSKISQVYDFDSGQPAIAALCLAWLGVDSAHMIKLRKEQVDTKAGIISDLNGSIIVSQMPACIRDVLSIYAKTYSAQRTQNQTFTVYADDRGFFLKRMITQNSKKTGKPITTTNVAAWILEMRVAYENMFGAAPELTYTNVQRSGGLYRLHQAEIGGHTVRDTRCANIARLCLGNNRSHADNMIMYDAYLQCIGEK